jgi:hypothetical protein
MKAGDDPVLGKPAGQRVTVFRVDPGTGERLRLLATATIGDGGWVNLPSSVPYDRVDTPIIVGRGLNATLRIPPVCPLRVHERASLAGSDVVRSEKSNPLVNRGTC